jgi:phospholipid/cholesterol/gamma-HCH transport system permease protein
MSSFGLHKILALLENVGQVQAGFPIIARSWLSHIIPGLASLIVIGRNCTAVAADIGTLQASGSIRTLQRQGIDPFLVLVLPRVLAMAITSLCLGVVFTVALAGIIHVWHIFVGAAWIPTSDLIDMLLQILRLRELIALPSKMLLTGLVGGAIGCIEGLRTRSLYVEMPRRMTRAFAIGVVVTALAHLAVSLMITTATAEE